MQTNKNRRPYILTGVKSDENLVIGVLKGGMCTVPLVKDIRDFSCPNF